MSGYDYESKVVSIPDYPEPGVIFKDITPLFSDPEAFKALVRDIADHFRGAGITKVVGAEARGFMLGAPVALELGAGFVPARKPGKLPREPVAAPHAPHSAADPLHRRRAPPAAPPLRRRAVARGAAPPSPALGSSSNSPS